jgi:DNA polymerase III delta subunit
MPFREFTANIFQPLAEEAGSALPKTPTHNILKQNPYVAYKIFQTLNAFTIDELVTALEKSLDVDVQLKTSKTDTTCILEQLVCELCTASTERRSATL